MDLCLSSLTHFNSALFFYIVNIFFFFLLGKFLLFPSSAGTALMEKTAKTFCIKITNFDILHHRMTSLCRNQ